MSAVRYLKQTVDYLGFLATTLRDLQGFPTVVNELLQNSDDAPGVTEVSFDVRHDALVVRNNAPFRQEDFDRLQTIASGAKRDEAATIGAFGIGLIALYQITDTIELKSVGKHWIVRPNKPEKERIEEHDIAEADFTEFRFPWAFDPDSDLRRKLRSQAVKPDQLPEFVSFLEEEVALAALFLRKIETLEVHDNGKLRRRVQRTWDEDQVLIDVGGKTLAWQLVPAAFDVDARDLRANFPGRIEDARESKVTIAIPDEPLESGVLYAFLPTQHYTGLPFHLNADFYPTADRKRVLFEKDYQSEWNRAAIRAAAEAVVSNLERLRDHLGPQGIWKLISDVQGVGHNAQRGDEDICFSDFWNVLRPALKKHALVYTSERNWTVPGDAVLLGSQADDKHVPLLQGLGIRVVNGSLRPYFNLLISTDVGVPVLNAERLAAALRSAGLAQEVQFDDAPPPLGNVASVRRLWELINSVVQRDQSQNVRDAGAHFASCAVALSEKRTLAFPPSLFRADRKTAKLFERLIPSVEFLDDLGMGDSVVAQLTPEFSAEAAVRALEHVAPSHLVELCERGEWTPRALYEWFEARKLEVLDTPGLRDPLRELTIWPAGGELGPLSEVSLPGTFEDPLHLTSLVDVAALGGHREFLVALGVHELSLEVYVKDFVAGALRREDLSAPVRRRVVTLLAEHVGKLRDRDDIRDVLARSNLVECEDKAFRSPLEVYVRSKEIVDVLGDSVHYAKASSRLKPSIRDLYHWLGVADRPRGMDVCHQVERLASKPPIHESVQAVTRVFRYLGANWGQFQEPDAETYGVLRSLKWLPATSGPPGWYAPHELYAVYQDYLFDTQGRFLAIPRKDQNASSSFIGFLGIPHEPPVALVVKHLLACAKSGRPVNEQVYRFLNDHADDAAIWKLKDSECILLPDGRYVRPETVFWSQHPFGRYRHQLGQSLHGYHALFDAIGIREAPTPGDAVTVLLDISSEFGTRNAPLDDEAQAVVQQCWHELTLALERGDMGAKELEALGERKVVPNGQGVLQPPTWMFFEDRPGFADRFRFVLKDNLVERIQGIWPAMRAAGVLPLSEVIRPQLLECSEPVEDLAAREAVRERQPQLQRVLETHRAPSSEFDAGFLTDLRFSRAEELTIRLVLQAFRREFRADPEHAAAFLDDAQLVVHYVPRGSSPPWSAIARELAYAFRLDTDAGPIATGIKEVLAAPTAAEAEQALDELGYAPLQQEVEIPREAPVIEKLGAVHGGEGVQPAGTWPSDGKGQPAEAPPSTEEALKAILGEEGAGPVRPPEDLIEQGEPSAAGTGGAATRRSRPGAPRGAAPKHRGRLRSYVCRDGDKDNGAEPDETAEGRDEVDDAGVRRVEDYERAHGRTPKVMPPRHPGYDIESTDAEGNIERYIEVKSLAGAWDSLGAGLTRPQFDKARDLGEKAWLYVVEKALSDEEFRIYTIRDPALKVDQFMYDDGWKDAAEDSWSPDMSGREEA